MKKSIISLAVAAGMVAAGAASADAKFYGHAQVEVASWGGDFTGQSVEDNARGRFGFKASEDLGGGLKGLAKFEFKVDTADGDASAGGIAVAKREMLVGLKGGWGQFEAGRLKSAYKYYGGVKYDPFVATVLEARGNGSMSGGAFGHNSFISNSLGYQHKVGMVSFRITYDVQNAANGGDLDSSPSAKQGDNNLTAGLKFGGKKWEAGVAYVDEGADTAAGSGSGQSGVKLFGKYDFGKGGKLQAQYEDREDDTGAATKDDITHIYANYQFKVGKKNVLEAAYGNGEVKNGGTVTDDVDFLRLAAIHKFSKQTKAWLGYRSSDDKVTGGLKQTVIAAGLQKRF